MAKPALNSNAMYAYRYLQDKYKLKDYQAAGIVGNLMQESTFNTGARNAGDGGDGSDSIGIGQWNQDRARNFYAFAGNNAGNLDTQLDFVMHELNGEKGPGAGSERAAWNKLQSAGNVHDATAAMISYERPSGWSAKNPTAGHGFDNRLSWAGEVLGLSPDAIASAAPSSSATVTPTIGAPSASGSAASSLVAKGTQIANPSAGKPYSDGLIAFVQNKFGDGAPAQPATVAAGDNGKATEASRGLLEKMGFGGMPESVLGVETNKALDTFGAISKMASAQTDSMNKQVQAGAQAGAARRAANPQVEIQAAPSAVMQSGGGIGGAGGSDEEKKKKMLLAMLGLTGMGGNIG